MTATLDPRNGIYHSWSLGENGWNTGMDANLLKIAQAGMHLSVLDKDLDDPPSGYDHGDSFIVGSPDSGSEWNGYDGYIAVWDDDADSSGDWRFYEPREGYIAFVEDEKLLYVYSGAVWEILRAGLIVGSETSAATITIDWSEYDVCDVTLSHNATINATGGVDGRRLMLRLRQDGTGTRVPTWGSMFRFSTDVPEPTLSTAATTLDRLAFEYCSADGKYDCLAVNLGF